MLEILLLKSVSSVPTHLCVLVTTSLPYWRGYFFEAAWWPGQVPPCRSFSSYSMVVVSPHQPKPRASQTSLCPPSGLSTLGLPGPILSQAQEVPAFSQCPALLPCFLHTLSPLHPSFRPHTAPSRPRSPIHSTNVY